MYTAALKYLKKLLGERFKPARAGGDFEQAPQDAFKNEFPEICMNGCLFHSTCAIFKKSQRLGLAKAYFENPEYYVWLKQIMAVAMLPPKLIKTAFGALLRENIFFPRLADLANFGRLKRYIQKQWVDNKKVPAKMLSVYKLKNATNNGCESFHARIKGGVISEGIFNLVSSSKM